MMRFVLAMLIWAVSFTGASAHEVRPVLLSLTETAPQSFDVMWKQPVLEGKRLKIKPILPEGCEETAAHKISQAGSTAIEAWSVSCAMTDGLIKLEGLERTLTDAFVQISYLENDPISAVLKPSAPTLDLSRPVPNAAGAYMKIGVEHILFGWDHLLFVMGLVFLVRGRKIIGVATAFTVAHSITLGLAAMGWLRVSTAIVEILIAMSLVLLAVEILRARQGKDSLSVRRPYLISFVIGLVHGCGFAAALASIGLPKGTELLALLLFNVGVEIGQIAIIALLVAILWLGAKAVKDWRKHTELLASYFIGTIGVFWAIQRIAAL